MHLKKSVSSDVTSDGLNTVFMKALLVFVLLIMSASAKRQILAVIGGGLSGCSAALEASKAANGRWLEIVILEKESKLGGNSMKASSGINAAEEGDVEAFEQDTSKSGGGLSRPELIKTLVGKSAEAMKFLEGHGVELSGRTQLGGHSKMRTRFNPYGANVGFAIMLKLIEAVKHDGNIRVIVNASVLSAERKHGGFVLNVKGHGEMEADAVVLATGGFGANKALLERYSKQASVYATTNGPWSTGYNNHRPNSIPSALGDGLDLGKELGAELVHLEEVQIHPTGFVDPKDPTSGSKILAAEKLRGSGGILLNLEGRRFVDELNRRDHVYNQLSSQTDEKAWLVLSSEGGDKYNVSHMGFYMKRGLIEQMPSLSAAAQKMSIPESILTEELMTYNRAATAGKDAFGKMTFPSTFDLDAPVFVSMITPVVHYTMGGVSIDAHARALDSKGQAIPGLYAVGEVSGGLHGKNRLGGNSLLDCVVFGRQAGGHAAEFLAPKTYNSEL